MSQYLAAVTIVVSSYDEALAFYVDTLGFNLIEDKQLSDKKRWILVAPPGSIETRLLLAEAVSDEQHSSIGRQTGGRVFIFLHTDDFYRDYESFLGSGVVFVEQPRIEEYGIVAVFLDPFGNKWDLVQYN